MALKDYPEKLRPYLFHGVNLNYLEGEPEATGECFLCQKEDHLFVNVQEGTWHCQRCTEAGNVYTFLQRLYGQSWEAHEQATTSLLGGSKNLHIRTMDEWGVVDSILTGDPLIPGYNIQGKLATLYRVIVKGDKWQVLATPTTKRHPFGWQLLNGQSEVYLCEGPWDAMTLYQNFMRHRRLGNGKITGTKDPKHSFLKHAGVVGLSGITHWTDDLVQALPGKITLAFDNDHPKRRGTKMIQPGWDGTMKITKALLAQDEPPRIQAIDWSLSAEEETPPNVTHNPEYSDGYDISDLFMDFKPPEAIRQLLEMRSRRFQSTDGTIKYPPDKKLGKNKRSKNTEAPALQPIPCHSFRDLVKHYHAHLHFPRRLENTLAVLLSTVVAVKLKGVQVWFRLIGPPGSGKSTLAEALAAVRDHVFPISHFTGLHSGYVEPGSNPEDEDNSLIVKMHQKCTIVKDADTLLSNHHRNTILSEFRDVFDGTSRAHYRNKVTHEYEDINTSLVLCGTDDLRMLNRSTLGERFLDYDILGGHDGESYVDRTMRNATLMVAQGFASPPENEEDHVVDMTEIKRATMGYIHHLDDQLAQTPMPTSNQRVRDRIKGMANFVSLIRTKPKEQKHEGYRVRPELPTRLSGQLQKLAICLAYVLNKKAVDKQVMRILQSVAVDTSQGYQLELASLLYTRHRGMSTDELSEEVKLSKQTVRDTLDHMQHIGVVDVQSMSSGKGQSSGRNFFNWTLTSPFRTYYKLALK